MGSIWSYFSELKVKLSSLPSQHLAYNSFKDDEKLVFLLEVQSWSHEPKHLTENPEVSTTLIISHLLWNNFKPNKNVWKLTDLNVLNDISYGNLI